MMENKPSFLKDHADTIAIIGVNITIAAILVAMFLSNLSGIAALNHRVDAANARSDAIHMMIYDMIKEMKK
jgi:hypothetical protein